MNLCVTPGMGCKDQMVCELEPKYTPAMDIPIHKTERNN